MFESLYSIQDLFNVDSRNWRGEKQYFHKYIPLTRMLKPGTASFSPAWFELGHDVSNERDSVNKVLIMHLVDP